MRNLLAASIALLASSAWAQDAPTATDDTLNEIVITAQRRSENLERAALPVAVLSPQLLIDAGATRPSDLSQLTPALQVAGLSGSYTVYYIRGVGNFSGNSLAEPAITFNYDGVSIGRPSSTTGFFYDLERIEILKGPQGTLYGRNATGGAVNVLPRRPELGVFGGSFLAEYGEYESTRVDGALNIPLGDRAALRAAGTQVRHDGFMDDGGDDQDDTAGRLSFLLQATPTLSIAMAADYFHQEWRGPGSTPIVLGPDHRFGISSPEAGAFYETQRVGIAGRNFNPIPATQRLDNEFWGVNATVTWETPLGEITIIPAYRETHLNTIGSATGLTLTILEHDEQSSIEARLASDTTGRLSYVVGAMAFEETNDVPLFVPNNQYNMSIQQPWSHTESAAAYGQATWSVTDDVRINLGARYTEDDKTFRGYFQSFNRLCPPVPTANCPNSPRFPAELVTPPILVPPGSSSAPPVFNPADGTLTTGIAISSDESASFSHTTWRAAVEWDVAERSLLYASYQTAYKSGGFFFSNDSEVYRPEYVDAVTVGWKNRLFDNRLQLDVEAFRWSYEDQQVSHITLDSLGVSNLRTENVGEATIQGVEIEAQWLPQVNTLLSADVQYLDAVYDQFAYVTPLSSGPPVTGCLSVAGASGFNVDCSGKQPPYAPRWTVNLGVEQTFPLSSGANVVANARAHYQSETLTGLDFTPLEYQDGYWWIDADVTLRSADGRRFISVFGRNLTDETIVANTFQPPLGRFVVGSLRPPRVVGVRLGATF